MGKGPSQALRMHAKPQQAAAQLLGAQWRQVCSWSLSRIIRHCLLLWGHLSSGGRVLQCVLFPTAALSPGIHLVLSSSAAFSPVPDEAACSLSCTSPISAVSAREMLDNKRSGPLWCVLISRVSGLCLICFYLNVPPLLTSHLFPLI